jgi:hypothetical protein
MTSSGRDYQVRLHDGRVRRSVVGDSFEAAALAYLEECHPPADADGDVVVIVRDEGGGEQCFRIEVATGHAEPCGES